MVGSSSMGLTHVRATIANPAKPRKSAALRLMVDSGAVYSVVPSAILRQLGIEPHSSRTFIMADGTEIRRKMGNAVFRIGKNRGTSTVIFGEGDDAALLGIVSLEELGLILDPLKRVLRPLPT